MKVYLVMGGPSEGSNAGTHTMAKGMRIYLGTAHAGTRNKDSQTVGAPGQIAHSIEGTLQLGQLRILLSYHYYQNEHIDDLLTECFGDIKVDVFADSGAYSAMTSGKPIDFDAYIEWVNRWKHRFTAVSSPDVIGDPAATTRETERMLQAVQGVPVLPVFHVGEDWSYLSRWAADPRVDYLALGGMVPYTRRMKLLTGWLTKAFNIIKNPIARRPRPAPRVHGFGLTTWPLLKRFPFYSVDSSSWTSGFRYARLHLFDKGKGEFVEIAMDRKGALLHHSRLLAAYGLRSSEAQSTGYSRDRIVAAAVQSWQCAEAWLAERKGAQLAAYLSCGAHPGGPNAKAGTGDVRSLGSGLGTRKAP